jgi:hypothetical protein
MKKLFFLCTILLVWNVVASGQTQSAANQTYGKFGAGFVAGDPTGLSWKYRFSQRNALEGAVGFLPDNGYRVNMDYLWHTHPFSNERFGLDYGAGIAVGPGRTFHSRGQDIGFGLRGVAGLNYLIPNAPLDLFTEAAPIVVMSPEARTLLDVGFGMRVYF